MSDKTMTWTRWAVKVRSQNPDGTYYMLQEFLTDGPRFKVVSIGVHEPTSQVRAVVEYTAKGANSDDIKRRFTQHGIPRENVETINVASVDMEWGLNADLIAAIDSTAADVVAQVAVDVSNAAQQRSPDDAMQVSWAVSMIDTYNEPIVTGQALVNAQEYFAVAVA